MKLTQEQQARLEIFEKFGPRAKEAFEFIFGKDFKSCQVSNQLSNEDGIYFIYNDGTKKPISSESVEGVKYIGIVKDGHSLAISLTQKEIPLQDEDFDRNSIKNDECYIREECRAIFDWNGKKNTEHLLKQGTELGKLLNDGEYIPSLGEVIFMYLNKDILNAALELVGGEPFLDDEICWSSTEYNQYISWYVNFSTGSVNNNYKSNSSYVRPVVAFNA